jgi:hypothetical protein
MNMAKMRNLMDYTSLLNEEVDPKVVKSVNASEFYTTASQEVYDDVVHGMTKFELEPVEKLKYIHGLAKNKDFAKLVIKNFQGGETRCMDVIPGILNELSEDDKNINLVTQIHDEMSTHIYSLDKTQRGLDIQRSLQMNTTNSPEYINRMIKKDHGMTKPEPLSESDEYSAIEDAYNLEITELSEGVREKAGIAGDKAKAVVVGADKKIDAFGNMINKMKAKYMERMESAKGEQIAKESWQVARTIRRLLMSAPFAAVNPAIALMVFASLKGIDSINDSKIRAKYIGDLKLEIKIIEEKISIAERKGDDKSKIEMIRNKDKLERTLEKLQTGRAKS